MPTVRGEFIRKLGCLCIHVQRLNRSLQANDFCTIESESQVIQDLVLELIKNQRKLSKDDQRLLRPRFAARREDALHSLEMSRHVLDESHDAAISLLRAVQEAAGIGFEDSGPSLAGRRN
jgi:hypothetical protein